MTRDRGLVSAHTIRTLRRGVNDESELLER